MSLKNNSVIAKGNESHVCSAQSDSIGSLQFDKRVKIRSYSSQYTISDQIIVGIDRREEFRPIENNAVVEIDLSVGLCNNDRLVIDKKYQKIYRLDDMASTNAWLNKMITYDGYVDKDIMTSIRDEAMEPNKLYLLKHKHEEKTSGNYFENPTKSKLRTTAAQFNPQEYNTNNNKSSIDKIVPPTLDDKSLNVYLKSKNVLRNELIIRTGDFINPTISNDHDKYSTSLSVDLTTHKIPQIVSIEDITNLDDEDSFIKQSIEKENCEEPNFEKVILENDRKSLNIEDIPFAEEWETNEIDQVDNKRNTLSKSMQYYLPVFESSTNNEENERNLNIDNCSNYSRENVTTDDNESIDQTDKATLLDEEDCESLNVEEFDESITEHKNSNEIENYSLSSERNSYCLNRSFDPEDIICQENLVMHIHQETNDNFINSNDLPKLEKLISETKVPFSQFDLTEEKEHEEPISTLHHKESYKNRCMSFPKDFIEQRKEHEEKTENLINGIYIFNEKEIEPIEEFQTSLEFPNQFNEDENVYIKTKSFSLKRNSGKFAECSNDDNIRPLICPNSDENIYRFNPVYYTLNSTLSESPLKQTGNPDKTTPNKTLYVDRKEKFLNSNFNSSIQFFQQVSDEHKSPVDTRSSSPFSDTENDSNKKSDASTKSSDGSMIIKDVSSDDAYEFPKRLNKTTYEILEEDENVSEKNNSDDDSNKDLSNIITSTEEIPDKSRSISSTDDLSQYSSSSTVTVNDIILTDLVKTPIDSTPGHFEKFLRERELRLSKDKMSTDENSSFGEETIEHAVFVKNIHTENDETQFEENKFESSYTEDTSSSSSDYSENINPVLRQGESMEDIEKYLNYSYKENVGLKRSSGFEEQLNIAYNQENNDENLLYQNDIDNRHFSTSSDDNMSLEINKSKPIEITKRPESISEESLQNDKPLTRNKFEEYSSSETITSDSELSEISVPQEKPVKQSSVTAPSGKINKQMSMPTLHKDLSESSSDSGSTQSISTSTDNTAPKTDKILKLPKSIERKEKFANNKLLKKQMSLPASKNHLFEKESSSESDDGSRSVSTSEDEIQPTNIKYIDRTEKQQPYNPKNKQISIPISKKILSNLSKSSESSQSFSTSEEEEIPLKNDQKSFESKFIDKEEKFPSNQSIDKKIFTKQSKRLSRSSHSKTNSSRSISTSSRESQHSYVNLKDSKFIDKEEKFPSSQSFNKEMLKPKFRKKVPKTSKSSSSQSVSTSSDEEHPVTLKNSKFIDKEEKFPSSQSFNKETIKPKYKKISKSSKSSSSQSWATSSDEEHPVNLKDSKFIDKEEKFPSSQSFNKEILKPTFKKQVSKSSKSSSSQSLSTSSDEEHPVNRKESKFIDKQEKFPSSQSFNKEKIKPKSKKEMLKSNKRNSSQSVSTSSDEEHPDQSYLSSTSSDEEPLPIPVKKEPSANENKKFQNIFIDRREKFTELNSSSKTTSFKRSSSVPNYLKDSNNFSSMDEDSHFEKEKLSQSLKSINTDASKNNLAKNEQNRSFELLRVELKENVITRFIESRRKYTDKMSENEIINSFQQPFEYNSKKNSSLSIDRREKFCSGEELDRITPCEILKDENPLESSKHSVSSLSDSSESVATSTGLSETKLSKHEKIEMEDFLSDNNISPFDDSYCQDDKLNYTRNLIDTLSPITNEYLNEIVKPYENTEITNTQDDKEKEIVICSENRFDQNEISDNKDEKNSISCSITSTESSENENEKEKDLKFIERNEKFPDESNLYKKFKHFKPKNENPMKNSKNSISSLSDSSESMATSSGISANKSSRLEDKPNKSIEHREKFAENKLGNNIKKKQTNNYEDDSTTSSASSTATKSFENLEKLLDKKENEREEKFANQYKKHLLYEKSKDKSDSTDEDISLSLTSYPKDNHEFQQHDDSIHSEGNEKEIIIVEIINPESKIKRESPSISMSTSTSISHEKYIKNKYEKNDRFVTRSSQTLPYNRIQMIPIKQKSKSLDKPYFNSSFPFLSQSVPGSLGSIVERRHHEFTETWSKKVPSDSNELKKTTNKTVIEDEHISTVKNTEIFMKRKFALPLTTRPRPFPSYLSPVNAFPYVPSDPEFSSEDSIVNDYSSDNNANEIVTRFKSLPDFVKSLSTTSLPKEPINSKKETIKKPLPKKKSPVTTIDLNYGAVENKNINRSKFKKKNSITSITTDSSYLDKPILKEKQVITNYASSDSLSSLTVQSSTSNQQQLKRNPKININKKELNYDSVSSTESSSDSDTQVSNPPIGKTSLNNKIQKPFPKNINGKREYIRKTASLPQKRIPSTSESSEFSSSSDDSAEIFHF